MADADLLYDWNDHEDLGPALPRVELDDETLRDGLQNPSVRSPDLEQKRACLRLMCELGIQRVDLGLPMSAQVEDIRGLMRTIRDERLPIQAGLAVRTVVADLETVATLRDEFPDVNLKASAFLGSSRIRMWVEGWTWQKVVDTAVGAIEWAAARDVPVMFVTEDTTRSHPGDIASLYVRAAEAGAAEVCVADTCGHALPWGARAIVSHVRAALDAAGHDQVVLNWHGHSDRGVALANCLAAIEGGAQVVHGTILGIGERSGNAQLDQLLVNLHLLGLWERPLEALDTYVQLVSEATGVRVPELYPMFGRDAFRTMTGVHAAAIAKARRHGDPGIVDLVYSAVPARLIGRTQEIEVGRLSGAWCVRAWFEDHGVTAFDDAAIARILERAQACDSVLSEAEIRALL